MPAIQNQLNLYVNINGQIVPGSNPINFLYRNNLNRNVFFVITPLSQAAVVKLIFKNTSLNKQGYTGVALVTTQTGKDITDKEASYFELVKDWNVFKYIPNSTILAKFPSTVTGSISLTVSITEPDLSHNTKYTYKGDLFVDMTIEQITGMVENDFYTCASAEVKIPQSVPVVGGKILHNGDKFLCLHKTPTETTFVIIKALKTRSTTEPLQFVGNPSLEDSDFEYDDVGDVSLLDGIISKQNEQTISIGQIQDYITDLNGGSVGAVESVAGKTGHVILDTDDIVGLEDLIDSKIPVEGSVVITRDDMSGYVITIDNGYGNPADLYILSIYKNIQYGKQYKIKYRDLFNLLEDEFGSNYGSRASDHRAIPIVIRYKLEGDDTWYAYKVIAIPSQMKPSFSLITTRSLYKYYSYLATNNRTQPDTYNTHLLLTPGMDVAKKPFTPLTTLRDYDELPNILVLNTRKSHAHDNARYVLQQKFSNGSAFLNLTKCLALQNVLTYPELLLQNNHKNISYNNPICILRREYLDGHFTTANFSVTNAFSHYFSVHNDLADGESLGTGVLEKSIEVNFTPPFNNFDSLEDKLKAFENGIRNYLGLPDNHFWRPDYEDEFVFTIGYAKKKRKKNSSYTIFKAYDAINETVDKVIKLSSFIGQHNRILYAFNKFLELKVNTELITTQAKEIGRKNRRLALYAKLSGVKQYGRPDTWYPVLFFKPFWDFTDDSGLVDIKGIFRIEPAIIAHKGVIERKKISLVEMTYEV